MWYESDHSPTFTAEVMNRRRFTFTPPYVFMLQFFLKHMDNFALPLLFHVVRRMRWAGLVARMRERRGLYEILVGKSERRKPLEDPGVDERIILKWIIKLWNVESWTVLIWLKTR